VLRDAQNPHRAELEPPAERPARHRLHRAGHAAAERRRRQRARRALQRRRRGREIDRGRGASGVAAAAAAKSGAIRASAEHSFQAGRLTEITETRSSMIRMRNRRMGLSAAAIRTGLGLLLAVFAAAPHAQVDITVRKGVARPVPIAVVPFGWQGWGPPPYALAAVITADLGNSGRFAPMAVRDMISRPTEPA